MRSPARSPYGPGQPGAGGGTCRVKVSVSPLSPPNTYLVPPRMWSLARSSDPGRGAPPTPKQRTWEGPPARCPCRWSRPSLSAAVERAAVPGRGLSLWRLLLSVPLLLGVPGSCVSWARSPSRVDLLAQGPSSSRAHSLWSLGSLGARSALRAPAGHCTGHRRPCNSPACLGSAGAAPGPSPAGPPATGPESVGPQRVDRSVPF